MIFSLAAPAGSSQLGLAARYQLSDSKQINWETIKTVRHEADWRDFRQFSNRLEPQRLPSHAEWIKYHKIEAKYWTKYTQTAALEQELSGILATFQNITLVQWTNLPPPSSPISVCHLYRETIKTWINPFLNQTSVHVNILEPSAVQSFDSDWLCPKKWNTWRELRLKITGSPSH